ncbi:DNA cytosine methyltransferase [Prevotella bivia]|uniref:DNA cytosine methyltransferase n=1 Tax=Prevotella bivia TaxID=28125 RepID=UPI00254E4959|nr:DNA cytosine methyltransferase [Prevotella bivia]MDU5344460.1 DNA cytosine methyltransferase [Prevotella bivia]MDZ3817973.1 DNA cytosine methyltransferase [Prevotella bivia]
MSEKKEFITNRKGIKYLDLFAGAGGFSEGFMQAYTENKYYDFRLASDINENCELTHRVRYNKMLGLDTKFLCQDIMEDSFLPNLLKEIGNQEIDVITGGPSCQSFSLAGRRKKLDKRDDLFYHYLKVIKALRPKYFVMENVKGILTKDEGRIKERILREIRSIVDDAKMNLLYSFLEDVLKTKMPASLYYALYIRLYIETSVGDRDKQNEIFFNNLEQQLKDVTKHLPYSVSKSDESVNTIRHGLLLLKMKQQRDAIRKQIIQLKTSAHIDNDTFVDGCNAIIETISDEQILEKTLDAIDKVADMGGCDVEAKVLKKSLEILTSTFDECIEFIQDQLKDNDGLLSHFNELMKEIRLYNIDEPLVLLSSNYGVPQNRERVVFIGCRNDQEIINEIPATVTEEEKVKVYESLWDLNMIDNGETVISYKKPKLIPKYEGTKIQRAIQGEPDKRGLLFCEWSKIGRLGHRFIFDEEPFYVLNMEDLEKPKKYQHMELFNHQTILQNAKVRERLRIIAEHGDYDEAKAELKEKGLESQKRNYVVLNPLGQSPTVCTMPDDFIHYSAYRPMTVREMARLQSFDDSFVFQGKRQTGGNNRQKEIPQYTLVGNAVPPLMARAIANTLLKHIK